jgi:hypothetical protein
MVIFENMLTIYLRIIECLVLNTQSEAIRKVKFFALKEMVTY